MENEWSAVVLAALNLLNLSMSTWNHRKLEKVRDEQKRVERQLSANGVFGANGVGGARGHGKQK